jgi:hypothetical protein
LIFQLLSTDHNLQAILGQTNTEDLKRSIDEAGKLLTTLLACGGPVYIIVDGLDEIEKAERCTLLQQLLKVSDDCEELKILISSRIEDDITKLIEVKADTIRVDHQNVSSIQAFITQRTKTWYQERKFIPEAQTEINHLLKPLALTSKGIM